MRETPLMSNISRVAKITSPLGREGPVIIHTPLNKNVPSEREREGGGGGGGGYIWNLSILDTIRMTPSTNGCYNLNKFPRVDLKSKHHLQCGGLQAGHVGEKLKQIRLCSTYDLVGEPPSLREN